MRRSGRQPANGSHVSKLRHSTDSISTTTTPDREAQPAQHRTRIKSKHTPSKSRHNAPVTALKTTSPQPATPGVTFQNSTNNTDVEEYVFTSEDYVNEEMEDDVRDDQSHISLSSDGNPEADFYAIDDRPWLSMNADQRRIYEEMFVNVTNPAVGQSWSYTEQYQSQIDDVLLKYMQDYPLPTWQIGTEAAEKAYHSHRERARWRVLGIKIYGSEQMPNLYQARQFMSQQQNGPPPASSAAYQSEAPAEPINDVAFAAPTRKSVSPSMHITVTDDKSKIAQDHSLQSVARPTVPPYPKRRRPAFWKAATEHRQSCGTLPKSEPLPWNRDIDYRAAFDSATWDDNIYDNETITAMDKVRQHNALFVQELEQNLSRKRKRAHEPKEETMILEESTTDHEPMLKKRSEPEHHFGSYIFHTRQDELRAQALGFNHITTIIDTGMQNRLSLDELHTVKLSWYPSKRATATGLVQVSFSVRDLVLTRKQVIKSPILTRRAAQCIIDFTPDWLWRSILLRICSEAGFSNKDLQDRFLLNGCHTDRSMFTKRISTALGRHQARPTTGTVKEANAYYEVSSEDFRAYTEFFGLRNTATASQRRYTSPASNVGKKKPRARHAKVVAGTSEDVVIGYETVSMQDSELDAVPD